MQEQEFARRLRAATDQLLEYLRPDCDVVLPDEAVYNVQLNCSYDGHADPELEAVYPADSEPGKFDALRECSADQAVTALCRDGRIPVWINMTVLGETGTATIVQLTCAGRYTADETRFYHQDRGHPPFAFKADAPPNSQVELRSLQELGRLPRIARHVRKLTLVGQLFDDDALAILPPLPHLNGIEVRDTRVVGHGLARLARESTSLDSLHVVLDPDGVFNFNAVPNLPALKNLKLEQLPSTALQWGAHLQRTPGLEFLTLCGRADLAFDLSDAASLAQLKWLDLRAKEDLQLRGSNGRSLQHLYLTAGARLGLPAVLEPLAFWLTMHGQSLSPGSTMRGQVELLSIRLAELDAPVLTELLAQGLVVKKLSLGGTPLNEAALAGVVDRLKPSHLAIMDCGLDEDACRRIKALHPPMSMEPWLG